MRPLLLTIIATVLPVLATAQDLAVPGRLDLNGMWELNEYGQRRGDGPAIVRITHSGSTVHAAFVAGAECWDGQARPDAFLAEIKVHPTNPPTGQLSSPAMWVCSGSPDMVKKCGSGGAIKPSYKTTFTNAVADPDYIEGKRVTQGVNGCSLDPSENGIADFSLRRLQPCELEELKVRQRETELRAILKPILETRAIFRVAIRAAEQRYPQGFNGMPTSTLEFPDAVVGGDWDAEIEWTEQFFTFLPDDIASADWIRARDMAAAMGLLAEQPVLAVREMLNQMYEIEKKAPLGRQGVTALRQARAELEKCRRAQP